MPIPKNQLAALLQSQTGRAVPEVMPHPMQQVGTALPIYPNEVGYCPPNSDGSRKSCQNCYAYATQQRRCYLHNPQLDIAPDAVCGYHVFTEQTLQTFKEEHALPMDYLTPDLSGLERVPGGTSCDLCVAYQPVDLDHGVCNLVSSPGGSGLPAEVQPLGCCMAWRPR